MTTCNLCDPAAELVIAASNSWRILRAPVPVTAAHALVAPRAHVVAGQWLNSPELFGVAYQHGRSLGTDFAITFTFQRGNAEHLRVRVIPGRGPYA